MFNLFKQLQSRLQPQKLKIIYDFNYTCAAVKWHSFMAIQLSSAVSTFSLTKTDVLLVETKNLYVYWN